MFEVYRFAVPTAFVVLAVWRWANGGIDPAFSQRYWWIKMLFGILGYAAAFVTGAKSAKGIQNNHSVENVGCLAAF